MNPAEALYLVVVSDIWRTEQSEAERRGVSAIVNAIEDYSIAPQI